MSEQYIRHPNIECTICNKKIYRRPSAIKRNSGNAFCSQTCYGISNRKEIPCLVCGKLILSGLNKKTCSRACANKHRAGMQYRGRRPEDKVKYLRGLKIRLLAERGKKCQRCGYDKYEILQVHHVDRNTQNNDLKNLQLICPNCHYEEHFLEKSWLKNYLK